ncbi:uncharacterized protein (TIGR03083 family) [Arthrobacter sp. UYP6]|uniref:maleylpyruvate isomerase family mycothiol-dependent enzyme n=1 Tax=Arthrobacter sp. UYP6 TaxID=1756378 RepID=UPI0033932422
MNLPEFRGARSVPIRRRPVNPHPPRTSRSGSVIWPVVQEERRALIQDLEPLQPQQWQTPSLCSGWSIHDVLAHLVDTAKATRSSFVHRMITARFDFDHVNALGLTRERTDDPRATLAEFRAVLRRRTGPPVALPTRLVESFVHGEDIRRPLKIARTYPGTHIVTALNYQLKTSVKIGGGKEIAEGWRLVSTDEEFAHGAGSEVRGPAIALLLAVSGRQVYPEELSGPGAAAFLSATAK